MLVSFRDRLKFDASSSYLKNVARCDAKTTESTSNGKQMRAFRGVNFSPKYHQRSLTSPTFVFSRNRCTQESLPDTKDETMTGRSYADGSADGKSNVERFLPNIASFSGQLQAGKHKSRDFRRSFRPKRPKDDLARKARDWREFTIFPYTNPQPYDHRGLDEDLLVTALRTVRTPDPFNLKFKTAALRDGYKQCYAVGPQMFTTQDTDFKFRTFKTPEPHFIPELLFPKRRYSPAFTASNAYFERIAKSIFAD